MKKIVIASVLSISSLLLVEYLYIKATPTSQLITRVKSFKNETTKIKDVQSNEVRDKTINQLIKVIDVKTGFYASNIWYASTIVTFKNISNTDLKQYIKSKVVFIDKSTGEQIGVHTKYLCTSHEIYLSDTTLRKQFKSDVGYRGSYSSLNIIMKLYLEDTFIGDYNINNTEI